MCCTIQPLIDGATTGPRLPKLEISAMHAAAAAAYRYSVTSVKKSGVAAAIPITAKESAVIEATSAPPTAS